MESPTPPTPPAPDYHQPPRPESLGRALLWHLFLIFTLSLITTEFAAIISIPGSPLHPFPWALFKHQLATFLILDTVLLTLISLQTPLVQTIPDDLTSRRPHGKQTPRS